MVIADAYLGNFAKGGKLFEDNGGLPVFDAGETAAQQAQSMQQHTRNAQNSSQPWHQQQAGCTDGHCPSQSMKAPEKEDHSIHLTKGGPQLGLYPMQPQRI